MGGQQHGHAEQAGGEGDHPAALAAAAESADEGRGESHRQGGGGDAPVRLMGADVEARRQFVEDALGGIEIEERSATAEKQREAGKPWDEFMERSAWTRNPLL